MGGVFAGQEFVSEIVLEGITAAGEENAEGEDAHQKSEFGPTAGVRVRDKRGEQYKKRIVDEVERKGGCGGLADDANGEATLRDLKVAESDAAWHEDNDCGDGDGVHPGDHAADVEPVKVKVVDEDAAAVNADDAEQAQRKYFSDGFFSEDALGVGIVGSATEEPERQHEKYSWANEEEDDDAGDDALSASEVEDDSEEGVVDALVAKGPEGTVGEK